MNLPSRIPRNLQPLVDYIKVVEVRRNEALDEISSLRTKVQCFDEELSNLTAVLNNAIKPNRKQSNKEQTN